MKGETFTAQEELLELYGIDRCPECHSATGNDTEYRDFSNKLIIICSQCGHEWFLADLAAESLE